MTLQADTVSWRSHLALCTVTAKMYVTKTTVTESQKGMEHTAYAGSMFGCSRMSWWQ